MNRIVRILLATLLCLSLLPTAASAATFSPSDTDISINLDDSQWYVFTRDNLENNPELTELGLSYEYMNTVFQKNYAYIDALIMDSDGNFMELFVRVSPTKCNAANLSNYSDDEVLEFAKEAVSNSHDYTVHKTQYKFAKAEYVDSNLGYYVCEYVTIVNKNPYVLTFQSNIPYTSEMYAEIDRIVSTVKFDVDTSLKEPEKNSFDYSKVVIGAIAGGVTGGAIGGVMALVKKKKKKDQQDNQPQDPFQNPYQNPPQTPPQGM